MFSHRTDRALTALLIFVVCSIVYATSAITATAARASILGVGDGLPEAAPLAAQLGARTYRLVMDPNVPLDAYAPRIEAYRAVGMRPQIVVGGTGTSVRGKGSREKWQIINYAIHALKRWPDSYSISVLNEPDLSGVSACEYAQTFRTAYRMLKAAGAQRVLFGEWSPGNPVGWSGNAALCTKGVVADGFAWHCYDIGPSWVGVTHMREIRSWLRDMRTLKGSRMRTRRGNALPIYCTEYGVPTRGRYGFAEQNGPAYWSRAFAIVRKYHVEQIVAWGIVEAPAGSAWDTSLVDSDGNKREAFATIASAR